MTQKSFGCKLLPVAVLFAMVTPDLHAAELTIAEQLDRLDRVVFSPPSHGGEKSPVENADPPRAAESAQQITDDLPSRLGLADMPGYRAALSGKATADNANPQDPPRAVSFRDLWDQADAWRGRRVIVAGRIARVFRQEAVGSFPPLVEAWVSTPAGDLFCIVFPQDKTNAKNNSPDAGRQIAFTGTFLRSIRYAATDQARLAPLIVGDRQPENTAASAGQALDAASAGLAPGTGTPSTRTAGRTYNSWTPLTWGVGLCLGAAAAGVLAWQHLREPARPARPRGGSRSTPAEPPLEFLDKEDVSGPTAADA